MFITDPQYNVILAREHGQRLRAEVAAERLHGASSLRRFVAASLRRAADRVEAGCSASRPAARYRHAA